MVSELVLIDEEMAIDEGLGYPLAYAKLCRDRSFGPYSHGPPFTFTPYVLPQEEDSRIKEYDEMFPIIDSKAITTTKPKIFVGLLWKRLNHLGNAGFDPEIFRVDPYGNVLYYHADSASPLAWDIDHWFPCTRGGLTVPSNLRILQWQVCKKKHNKLEFLIPWWEFKVGISINQFLSVFASSNSDFRHRAYSWLFSEGENELRATFDSHTFPEHFAESKEIMGLAPAAVVLSRRESCESPLKPLDACRRPRSSTPIIAAKKLKPSKENQDPIMATNFYQPIIMAQDSLKQREETVKMEAEIQKLDKEVNELHQKTEEEKITIQDLELVLMKRRRRAEKCRQLAESQCSYRAVLEKMIRDAMHQSVVYKEQVRLNQAAISALLARLQAQKAICDLAERDLHMKHKQKDELEKQIRPEWEKVRKRSRMDDTTDEEKDNKTVLNLPGNEPKARMRMEINDTSLTRKDDKTLLYLPGTESRVPLHKELWEFLEEEQRASSASLQLKDEQEQEIDNKIRIVKPQKCNEAMAATPDNKPIEEGLENLEVIEGGIMYTIRFPIHCEPDGKEDEESRKERGKGNIEKWLQLLLENTGEDTWSKAQKANENEPSETDKLIRKLNLIYPDKKIEVSRVKESESLNPIQENSQKPEEIAEIEARKSKLNNKKEDEKKSEVANTSNENTPLKNPSYKIGLERSKVNESVSHGKKVGKTSSIEEKNGRRGNVGKEKELSRSESFRSFRQIPSSPSLILEGMKKRVDCMRKKPLVLDDDDDDDDDYSEDHAMARNSFIRTIKGAVKI
ncbi:Hypothetical predicted protein [Olea europaea subsp. europaea]|uniref:Trichohyalin n=1 Tax=Olea europaea subsp. europaea TaxID=158383 RepID=A0A8S0UH51_OLEEU|nr:Hypothetical predicted protein [Olea europaea subsp. europaea]